MCVHRKPCYHMKDQMGGVKFSLNRSMCRVDHQFPYPPPIYSPVWYVESYIYRVLRDNCDSRCCHSVLWHTGSHHIIISNIISPFHLSLRKSKLTRLSLCLFSFRPLGFKVVFQLSLWASLANVNVVQPPAWPSWEPSDLSGLEPEGPPWAALVSSAFGCLSRGPTPIWLSQEPYDQSGLPLGLMQFSHLRAFWIMYIVNCAFMICFAFWLNLIIFFC